MYRQREKMSDAWLSMYIDGQTMSQPMRRIVHAARKTCQSATIMYTHEPKMFDAGATMYGADRTKALHDRKPY